MTADKCPFAGRPPDECDLNDSSIQAHHAAWHTVGHLLPLIEELRANTLPAVSPPPPPPEPGLEFRVNGALDLIRRYGTWDGEARKQWVLDQVVQALCGGGDSRRYRKWTDAVASDGNQWDRGIAP